MTKHVYVFRYPVWTWVCIAVAWFGLGHSLFSAFVPISLLIIALAILILGIVSYWRMRFRVDTIRMVAQQKGIRPETAAEIVRFK